MTDFFFFVVKLGTAFFKYSLTSFMCFMKDPYKGNPQPMSQPKRTAVYCQKLYHFKKQLQVKVIDENNRGTMIHYEIEMRLV